MMSTRPGMARYSILAVASWTVSAVLAAWGLLIGDPGRGVAMVHMLLLAVAITASLVHLLGRVIAPVSEAFRLGYEVGRKEPAGRPVPPPRRQTDVVTSLSDRRASR